MGHAVAAMGSPTIETERLRLLPTRVDDAVELAVVFGDPALYAFTGGEPPTPRDLESRIGAWLAGPSRPGEAWHNWTIRLADSGVAIGHLQATVTHGGSRADI